MIDEIKTFITPYLSGHEVKFLISLFSALIAGVIIGAEREQKGKAAGIGTLSFVIAGAAVFTMLSSLIDPASPARLAAQVITGVGFLGAGIIMKNDTKINNLTTAAEIWYCAGIGIALGLGYYSIAFLTLVFAAIVVRLPHPKKKDEV